MKKEWKAKNINLGSAIVGGFVTLFLGFIIGINWNSMWSNFAPYLGFDGGSAKSSIDFSSLNKVYSQLVSNYDGEIKKEDVIEGAKKGLVSAIGDIYTEYMTPSEATDFNASLEGNVGAGIGVSIAKREDYVKVIRTTPDNPARRAGILAGDIIYKINDEEVWDQNVEIVATKLRGDIGSVVKVTVVRDGKSLDFTLVREEINNISVEYTMQGDVAIMHVYRFSKDTGTEAQKLAAEFVSKGAKKVILDLRDNGGGYVSAAKDLLSLWLDGDIVLITKSAVNSNTATYASRGKSILKDTKTIVLINKSTASAAEITAAALQDYKKATIVGEQSFGKGVVQTVLPLTDGSLLKVTTAHWYSPHDVSINGTGVNPDISVERTYEQINKDIDPQLNKALELTR